MKSKFLAMLLLITTSVTYPQRSNSCIRRIKKMYPCPLVECRVSYQGKMCTCAHVIVVHNICCFCEDIQHFHNLKALKEHVYTCHPDMGPKYFCPFTSCSYFSIFPRNVEQHRRNNNHYDQAYDEESTEESSVTDELENPQEWYAQFLTTKKT